MIEGRNWLHIICCFGILSSIFLNCRPATQPISNELDRDKSKYFDSTILYIKKVPLYPGFTYVKPTPWIHYDLKYAGEDNFVKKQIYDCPRCYLTTETGQALHKVAEYLKTNYDLGIILFDCYRPLSAQEKLWSIVPKATYVTPPHKGSMHNRGKAIDLTLADSLGQPLDMGSHFDDFSNASHIDNTQLPKNILYRRSILRKTMVKFGFKGIRTEWWHFSYQGSPAPISNWKWSCD